MTLLLAGPTSVGKSTLMTGPLASRFGIDSSRKMVASQFKKAGPRPTVIHYNIFHGAYHGVSEPHFVLHESILQTILSTQWVDQALVLVASSQELAQRMRSRSIVEKGDGHQYEPERWLRVMNDADIFAVYEDLFLLLDRFRIPCKVIWSGAEADDGFEWSDRSHVHHLLRGNKKALPGRSAVEAAGDTASTEVAPVPLSHGIRTGSNDRHGERYQEEMFFEIFSRLPPLRSVLDMDCDLGGFLHAAERRGAERLVGLGADAGRLDIGRRLAGLLASAVELRHRNTFDPAVEKPFDCVAVIDVMHRTADFKKLLKIACRSSSDAVVVGFVDLSEAEFRRDRRIPWPVARIMNAFPVIGVSGSESENRFFVYSPEAVRVLIEENIGGFHRFADIVSPVKGRNLHIYRRTA